MISSQSRNPAIPQSRNPAIPQSRNPAVPQSRNPAVPLSTGIFHSVKEANMKTVLVAVAMLASFNTVAVEPVAFPAKAKGSVDANGKLVGV